MPCSILEGSKIIYACTEGSRVRSTIVRKLNNFLNDRTLLKNGKKHLFFCFCFFLSVEHSFPRNSLKYGILMAAYKLRMPTQQAANFTVRYVLSCHNVIYVFIY